MCTSRVALYPLDDLNEGPDTPGPELGMDWSRIISERREPGETFADPFHT